MRQVKIFTIKKGGSPEKIEQEINDWFKNQNGKIKVIQTIPVLFPPNETGFLSVFISGVLVEYETV